MSASVPSIPVRPRPRRPLWQRIGIGLSLALNVLVIGTVAGLGLSGVLGDRPPPLRDAGVLPYVAMLPPPMRREVMHELRATGPSRLKMAAEDAKLRGLITADDFDAAAFVAALDARQQQMSGFAVKSHSILAKALEQMPAAERRDYADRLDRFARFDHDRGPRAGKDGKPDRRPAMPGPAPENDPATARDLPPPPAQ